MEIENQPTACRLIKINLKSNLTRNICSIYARPFIREVRVEAVMGQEGEESSPHSRSFLTLITKLQIHSAFGVLQNTPAVIRRKIVQVVQRDPIMSKPLVTKPFERPDVSDGQVTKQFERPYVSNERIARAVRTE